MKNKIESKIAIFKLLADPWSDCYPANFTSDWFIWIIYKQRETFTGEAGKIKSKLFLVLKQKEFKIKYSGL